MLYSKLRVFVIVFLYLFSVIHISNASEYKNISGKKISWGSLEIAPEKGWIGKQDKKIYKMLYKYSENEYAAILIGKSVEVNYKQYKEVIKSTYRDFKKDPTNRNVKFIASSKYTILGEKHTPCITFITKGKRFFVFTPYVDGKMYMLLAISWRKDSLNLPSYTLRMLDNIYIKGSKKGHKNLKKTSPILPAGNNQKNKIEPIQAISYLDKFTNTAPITTTRSLINKLYGELSDSQRKILNKQFDKYYEYPCTSVKNYFSGLNRVLYKAVQLKTELSVNMAEYAKYSADAYNAYRYGNKQMAEESLRMLLNKRKQILDIHKKLNLVNSELAKYMKMPEPEKIKKDRQKLLENLVKAASLKGKKIQATHSSVNGIWSMDLNNDVNETYLYNYGKKIESKKEKAKNLKPYSAVGFMVPLESSRVYIKDIYEIGSNLHLLYLYRYKDKYSEYILAKKAGDVYTTYSKLADTNWHYKFTMKIEGDKLICTLRHIYSGDNAVIYRYVLNKQGNPKKYPVDKNYNRDELEEDFSDMLNEYRKLPASERVVSVSSLNDDSAFLQEYASIFVCNAKRYEKMAYRFGSALDKGSVDMKNTYSKLKDVRFKKLFPYPYEVEYSTKQGWIKIYTTSTELKSIRTSKNHEYVSSPDEEETPSYKKVLVASLYWNPPKRIYKENEKWNLNLKGESRIPITWRVYLPTTYSGGYDNNNKFVFKTKKQQRLSSSSISMSNALLGKSNGKIELEARITKGCSSKDTCPTFKVVYEFDLKYNKSGSSLQDADESVDISGLTDEEEFYNAQIEWLKKDIAAYKRMLRKAKTDSQREQIKLIIMGKKADLQQQKDLLNELKTGEFKHTTTQWDRYNANLTKELFIKESVSYQKRIGVFDSINRLSTIMKKHGYTGSADWALRNAREALKKSDNSQLEKIYRVLRKKYANTLEKEQAGSALKLLEAEDRLERVKKVKYWSEFGVMAGSMGYAKAGAYVYAGYTGITNGLSDGIASGIKHAVENLNSVTMVAASAYDGYNITDPTTGKKMGIKGAALNAGFTLATIGAIHMATSKVISRCSVAKNTYKKYSVDVIDSAKYQQEREMSLAMVKNYEKNIRHMEEELKKGNTEIVRQYAKKMESETEKLMASPHAKNYLKYKAPKSLQRVYIHYENKVKKRVITDFKNRMKKLGWQDFEVREFRNAASGDSVGMDWDLGLVEDNLKTVTIDGKPIKLIKKGGKYVTLDEFQKEAQREFNKAYKAKTGYLAETSFANLTTSVHEESFADVEILKNAAKAKPKLAKETARTIKHKALAMGSINTGLITKTGKYNEMCRGLAKEINTKLIPNLEQNKKLSKDGIKAGVKYFKAIGDILQKFGKNDISIVDAEIRIRNLTGKSIPEMAELISSEVGNAIKGKVK